MRILKLVRGLWLAPLLGLLLAACGGGSGGSPLVQPTPEVTYKLDLTTSGATLPSDGTSTVNLTARVRDASTNAAVSAKQVIFGADSGLLSAGSATTDQAGNAVVTLSAGSDKANRLITATASVGSQTVTATVTVSGTVLAFGGSKSAVVNQVQQMTVSLRDAANKPISGQSIALSASSGGSVPANVTSDSSGQATFNYTPAAGGTETLSARSLGASVAVDVAVSSKSISVTSPADGALVDIGTCLEVDADVGGSPANAVFAITRGQLYSTSSCGGAPSSVLTVAVTGGKAVAFMKSTNPGTTRLSVSDPTGGAASVAFSFVSKTPASITIQGDPSTVSVGGSSAISAFVRDANNNPVYGATVYFSAPQGGGALNPASATSNEQGVATTVFKADSSSSGQKAVVIQADILTPKLSGSASLTVSGQSVAVAIGSDNKVYVLDAKLSYEQRFIVTVADTAGNPIANQSVSVSRRQPSYGKGYWVLDSATKVWVLTPSHFLGCASEDVNGDGKFDSGDYNGNGTIEPDTATIVRPGDGYGAGSGGSSAVVTTDSTGSAIVYVDYPKDHAGWVEVELTATAVVQGVNNAATRTFWLAVPYDETKQEAAPPFVVSPFGSSTSSCSDPN